MLSYKGFAIPGDLPLIASVFFSLTCYSALLKILPLNKVITLAAHKATSGANNSVALTPSDEITLGKMHRAANFFLMRLWRSKRPCLRRTLVLSRWCRSRGYRAKIIIGVKKSGSGIKSHAWLEINSVPFREDAENLNGHAPIAESLR